LLGFIFKILCNREVIEKLKIVLNQDIKPWLLSLSPASPSSLVKLPSGFVFIIMPFLRLRAVALLRTSALICVQINDLKAFWDADFHDAR